MSIPKNKQELIEVMDRDFQYLYTKLEKIPVDLAQLHCLDGHSKGSKINVIKLLSYLIGWGNLVLKWHELEELGEEIVYPDKGFKWNELGKLAVKFYKDYEYLNSYQNYLDVLNENNAKLMLLTSTFTNEELYILPWYGKWTRGRMIQLNTSSPYKNVANRLRNLDRK